MCLQAAAAANKELAVGVAEAAADAAAGAGKKYVVVRVDVGSDAKALEKVSPRMPWW